MNILTLDEVCNEIRNKIIQHELSYYDFGVVIARLIVDCEEDSLGIVDCIKLIVEKEIKNKLRKVIKLAPKEQKPK